MLLRLVNSPPLPLATFSFIFSYLSFAAGQYVNPGNTTKVFFPTTSGKYDTGTFDLKFTDHSRTDPYSNTTIPRSILLQLFYPAENVEQYPLSSYMGPATAAYYQDTNQLPNNTFGSFKPNSHRGAPMRYCEQTQVILFSPGYGVSRLLYTGLAEDLASHGYLVISIDHPYDAPIVEFPDGSLAISNPPPLPENSTEFESFFKQQYETRVEDVLSILDPLYNNTLTKNIPGARGRLNISQVAMYGHSLGGATAAGAMLIDKRLLGGLNLDGSIFGDVLDQGLDRPYMIMAASDHNRTNDPSWETFWKKLQGWKRAVVLEGSTHMTFTDIPVIIKLINRPDILPPDIMELFVGSIDAYRAVDIQRSYILAFFNFLFRNKSGQLLNKPDRRYPEIKFWSF